MWTLSSERAVTRAALGGVAAVAALAAAFYWVQNQYRPIGGEVSAAKAAWLGCAILFWIVLPAVLVGDARLAPAVRRPFAALLALMLARAPVELWMLYFSLNWSPWYGIMHDAACLALLVAWLVPLLRAQWPPRERCVIAHLAFTAALFLPEMYFAWYMQHHFSTQGEAAVYFVPDDPVYAQVLRATTATVVVATLYLPFFLVRWLNASIERHLPRAP